MVPDSWKVLCLKVTRDSSALVDQELLLLKLACLMWYNEMHGMYAGSRDCTGPREWAQEQEAQALAS